MTAKRPPQRRKGRENATEAAGATARVTTARDGGGLWMIRVFVFISGAVLMCLEIVGSRVLAPDFGNSIFTWGSLITVVLAALSLGYFLGGHLADRRPRRWLLSAIGLLSAAAILAVPLIGPGISDAIRAADLGRRAGPLLATLVLFFPAGVLLGMVSPFAVKLCSVQIEEIGRTAGSLYALSTAGSILGTLLTGFVLIPAIGVAAILYCSALLMASVSVVLLITGGLKRGAASAASVLLLLLVAGQCRGVPLGTIGIADGTLVHYRESAYHNIAVVDVGNRRYLCFNRQIESGIETTPPYETACGYVELLPLVRIFVPVPERILFIGGGGGVAPRAFRRDLPGAEIDVVEIDPEVVRVSRDYFHFRFDEDPLTNVYARDGREFLRNSPDRYDIVVLDAFSIHGQVPFHLMTREFLEEVRDHLNPRGAVIMNLIGVLGGRLLHSELRTYDEVFPAVHCFPRDYAHDDRADRLRNVMIVGSMQAGVLSRAEVRSRAGRLVSRGMVTTKDFLARADDYAPDFTRDPAGVLLTDDHAPVELLQVAY